MFTTVEEITLGARYRDAVTGLEGIALSKTEHLTGCDRVTLTSEGNDPKIMSVDVTCLEYVDEGVSARFNPQVLETAGATPGASYEITPATTPA